MRPEACLEVASRSRKQAEAYLERGNAGRAFAHFLVALKLCPSWKVELSQHFIAALCSWGETLDQQQRHKDLFNCYEQALEVLPDSEEVLNSLGTHLYRWGYVMEACSYFRRAVACNPGFLPARRNFQGSCNLLVERWHFRMLNDSVRNDAYRAAIIRRVLQQGTNSSVLDIGTGTGILSLFAVEAGAGRVFACDCSPTMIRIASDVLHANGASSSVTLINKLSTDIVIPTDMPARVSLVVTETVDAGLLGEGILQSLIHAWEQLLLPAGSEDGAANLGKVVPEAADVWIVPIECLHIARKYWFQKPDITQHDLSHPLPKESSSAEPQLQEGCSNGRELDLSKLELTAKRDEPYDTEDLDTVPEGYKSLASPCRALHITFSDCRDMADWLHGQKHVEHCLTCTKSGQIDAIAMWFDLHLDDVTTLSSAPGDDSDRDGVHRANCWDQAIFPVQSPICVTLGQKLNIHIMCHGGKVSVDVHDQYRAGDTHSISNTFSSRKLSTVQSDSQSPNEFHTKDRKNQENISSTSQSDSEFSKDLSLNILANVKRKTSCLDNTNDMKITSNSSTGEHNEEGREMVLKVTQEDYKVTLNDTIMLDCLNISRSENSSNILLHEVPGTDIVGGTPRLDCSVVSQGIVQFLNDEQWMKTLKKTAIVLHQQLHISSILDLSPFPVLGLHLLMSHPVRLMCVASSAEDESAIRKVAELNSITTTQLQCMTDKQLQEMLNNGSAQFDVIMAHLVNPSGELNETVFNMIPTLRLSLSEGGIFLPQHISVMGQLLESDWLVQVSHVQTSLNTCGYDIAPFINTYQVTQHLDLNLSTLAAEVLSKSAELLKISLDRTTYQTTQIASTAATRSGMASAVAYWYNIHVHKDIPVICTANPGSYVNQAAILFQPCVSVCDGQIIKMMSRFHQGLIHVELMHGDDNTN